MSVRTVKPTTRPRLAMFGVIFVGIVLGVALTLVMLNRTTEVTETLYAAPVLGVVVDKDMKILYVEAGSTADKAGLQRGDVFETVAGVSATTDREKVKRAIFQATPSQQVMVKVKRGGQDKILTVIAAPPVFRPNQATPTPVPPSEDYF